VTTSTLLTRVALFAGLILVVQAGIGRADLPEELVRFRTALQDRADVLFFCDSTNRAHAPDDVDQRGVHELIAERLSSSAVGDVDLVSIDHAAYHPLVYRDYIDALLRSEHRPRAVIFALNTRSFLPGWAMRPGWQFERLRFSLHHPIGALFWQPLAVFKWTQSASISERRFREAPVILGGVRSGSIGDYLRGNDPEAIATPELLAEDLALRLTVNYLGTIGVDDARAVALRQAVTRCVAAGIDVVGYVTPVDIDAGEQYLPGRFADAVAANAEVLARIVDEAGGRCLNAVRLGEQHAADTGSSMFSWQRIPNEHLDETGRAMLADQVAASAAQWLTRRER